jgi:dihydrofolate reductase
MKIYLITAFDKNRLIGNGNSLPWKIKEEMSLFKRLTTDNIVLMGKNTYASIGQPLKNRINIVITSEFIKNTQLYCFNNIEHSLKFYKSLDLDKKLFIIGGLSIYKYFLDKNLIDIMYISQIKDSFVGDKYFPNFDENFWEKNLYLENEFFNTWIYRKIKI